MPDHVIMAETLGTASEPRAERPLKLPWCTGANIPAKLKDCARDLGRELTYPEWYRIVAANIEGKPPPCLACKDHQIEACSNKVKPCLSMSLYYSQAESNKQRGHDFFRGIFTLDDVARLAPHQQITVMKYARQFFGGSAAQGWIAAIKKDAELALRPKRLDPAAATE